MSGGKVGVRAAFHLKFIRDPSSGVWAQGWGLDIGVVFGAGSK
jgi:hypothetical protein